MKLSVANSLRKGNIVYAKRYQHIPLTVVCDRLMNNKIIAVNINYPLELVCTRVEDMKAYYNKGNELSGTAKELSEAIAVLLSDDELVIEGNYTLLTNPYIWDRVSNFTIIDKRELIININNMVRLSNFTELFKTAHIRSRRLEKLYAAICKDILVTSNINTTIDKLIGKELVK